MKMLLDRKEIAQALNFGKYPVLTYNVDDDKGSGAVVMMDTRHGAIRKKTTLYRGYQTKEDGIFWLMTHATVLSATVSVNDWLECAEYANAPVIGPGQEVAILLYSKDLDTAVVKIVKAGNKIDPMCSVATKFTEV